MGVDADTIQCIHYIMNSWYYLPRGWVVYIESQRLPKAMIEFKSLNDREIPPTELVRSEV